MPPYQAAELSKDDLTQNPLYKRVLGRIDHHIELAQGQIRKYGKWALFMRFVLPILTAISTGLASVLAGGGGATGRWHMSLPIIVASVTFLATIVATLNSAMRPILQYGHYVRYINKFWQQKVLLEFELELVLLEGGNPATMEASLHNRLTNRNREVAAIIESFSEESVSNVGLPLVEKHHS